MKQGRVAPLGAANNGYAGGTTLTKGPVMPKGPRFYKGSSRETPWNKDIMWQRYCVREAEVLGFKPISSSMNESSRDPANLPPLLAGSSLMQRRSSRARDAAVQQ